MLQHIKYNTWLRGKNLLVTTLFIIWISVLQLFRWKSPFRSSGQGDSLFKVILHRNGVQSWDMGESSINFLLPSFPHHSFPLCSFFSLFVFFLLLCSPLIIFISAFSLIIKPTSSSTCLSGWKLVPCHIYSGRRNLRSLIRLHLNQRLTDKWISLTKTLYRRPWPKPLAPPQRHQDEDSQTGEQLYQRSSCTAVKILGPTQISQHGGLVKGLGTPREFYFEGKWSLITELP